MAGLVMLTVRASDADSLVTRLFRKSGAPPSHANVVARHLVESSQLGVHSHGLIRVPQYVHEIRSGHLDPRAKPRRLGRHGAVSWVSGNSGFGQVGAIYSALAATASARRSGVGLVIAKNLGHTGRLGAYAELVANERCVAVLFGNGPPSSHLVAPFGGIDGRLATNPIAFAIPNGPTPVVADFSTSAMPEGKLRVARNVGGRLPPGVLQDPFGNATDDPGVLYGKPRGTLLPLGGPTFGHKGYALAILVEAMSTLLAGDETDDRSRVRANLAILAIATGGGFEQAAEGMARYLRSARPADPQRPVLVPGDPERLAREHSLVSVDRRAWNEIGSLARELHVDVPVPVDE